MLIKLEQDSWTRGWKYGTERWKNTEKNAIQGNIAGALGPFVNLCASHLFVCFVFS